MSETGNTNITAATCHGQYTVKAARWTVNSDGLLDIIDADGTIVATCYPGNWECVYRGLDPAAIGRAFARELVKRADQARADRL